MMALLTPGKDQITPETVQKIPRQVIRRRRDYYRAIKPQIWDRVVIEGRYKCHQCGGMDRLELHHIIPLEWGGSNDYRNIRPLCHDCHVRAHEDLGIGYGMGVEE